MKKLLLLLSLGLIAIPSFAAPNDAQRLAESARHVIATYPTTRNAIMTALLDTVQNGNPADAVALIQVLQTFGMLTPAQQTAATNRLNAIRTQKETALMSVKDTDPARAKAKLEEWLAAGLPISQATRDAVAAAQPTPAPQATPEPTPDDGL